MLPLKKRRKLRFFNTLYVAQIPACRSVDRLHFTQHDKGIVDKVIPLRLEEVDV